MTARNEAAVRKIVEQVRAELLRVSVNGVTKACDEIANRAQAYAPVSRATAARSRKRNPVELRPARQFKGQEARATRDRLKHLQEEHRIGTLARVSRNKSFLRSFRFKSPKSLRGQSPAGIEVTSRGGLRGFTRKQASHTGGELRDSIHVMGIEVTEGKVSGHVGSKLRYAGPVEYGYHHYSHGKATGTVVAGRPFLRKAGKEVGEHIADYFRE